MCVFICATCMQVPMEVKEHWIPWKWRNVVVRHLMGMLGVELGSSAEQNALAMAEASVQSHV